MTEYGKIEIIDKFDIDYNSIIISDNIGYFLTRDSLFVNEINNNGDLSKISPYDIWFEHANDIAVTDSFIYIGADEDIEIVNITNKKKPKICSHFNFPKDGLKFYNNVLYSFETQEGLK